MLSLENATVKNCKKSITIDLFFGAFSSILTCFSSKTGFSRYQVRLIFPHQVELEELNHGVALCYMKSSMVLLASHTGGIIRVLDQDGRLIQRFQVSNSLHFMPNETESA